jgi:hypothetical protein
MKTLFRLDHYHDNFGTFAGIFDSLEDIPHTLEPFEGSDTSIDHTEVTEFTAPDHLEDYNAWENGDIVKTHYFQPLP